MVQKYNTNISIIYYFMHGANVLAEGLSLLLEVNRLLNKRLGRFENEREVIAKLLGV